MAANVLLPPIGTGDSGKSAETLEVSAGIHRQVMSIGDRAGGAVDSIGGLTETAPITDTASSGLNGRLQRIAQKLGLTVGAVALKVGKVRATPSSVLTRPADTTAYAANDLVASSTTAGSVSVPSFTSTPNALGTGAIRRARLLTNKTSGMDTLFFAVEFWSAAPTFTNGDNGAYAVATGAAGYLGAINVSLKQVADGAYGIAIPDVGEEINFALASGSSIFWTLRVGATGFTPASGQTFTLIPEIQQD